MASYFFNRFGLRSDHRQVAGNVVWLFLGKALQLVVGLLVGAWIARYLAPEQFGLLNYALAFTGLFGAVASLGVEGVLVRDLVRYPDRRGMLLGTAGLLRLVGGAAAYVLALAAIFRVRPEDQLLHALVAVLGGALLFRAADIIPCWFEAQVQSRYVVWVRSGLMLVFAAVRVVLILEQASIMAFAWSILLEALVGGMALIGMMHMRGMPVCSLSVRGRQAWALLRQGWPLGLSAIAISIYMKIDQIMLGQLINDRAVGLYGAAVRISEVFYFVPVAITASVFPAILRAQRQDSALYKERLQQLMALMVFLGMTIAFAVSLGADMVVGLLFGDAYLPAAGMLSVHVWGGVFVFTGVATRKWLLAEDLQFLALERAVLGAASNVALNMLWIPEYGGVGAAWATVVSYGLSDFFVDLLRRQTRPIFWMKCRALNPFRYLTFHARM